MLTNNAEQFKKFLISKDIHLDFIEDKDGDSIVEFTESLDCGTKMRILVLFNKDDLMVSIYGLDFIQGINPEKKNDIYEAINKLNSEYSYFKYVLNKDSITVQTFDIFNNNFDCEIIMNQIIGIIRVVDTEYSGLMKIIWS